MNIFEECEILGNIMIRKKNGILPHETKQTSDGVRSNDEQHGRTNITIAMANGTFVFTQNSTKEYRGFDPA